ncbi:hypothetical protein LIER_37353 [Lithospermum erythrorhizon]|uniref:Pentatricopeptide repeat-containing protein n=1 Tax=Lithospermum erythrorhizon TaxID=34254 RepID=A0AAV3PJ63_LITER
MATLHEYTLHSPLPPFLTRPPNHSISTKPNSLSSPNSSTNHHKLTPLSHSSTLSNTQNLLLFQEPISSTVYASIIEACDSPRGCRQIHAHIIKNGFCGHEFVETKLLQAYAKCGCFLDAAQLFDKMPERNLYTWIAILKVYLDNGSYEDAFLLFLDLLVEDVGLEFFVFPVALKICSGYGGVELGRQFHGVLVRNGFSDNVYVGNALIDMYGKCGSFDDARGVLSNMGTRDRVSWNSMVTACAANGLVYEALEFLENMSLEDKLKPNFVTWSAIIGGFAQNGYDVEAIEMLRRMVAAGFEPNARTLASVLPACARLRSLELGKEIHGYIMRHGSVSNPFVVNGLTDLYRRCGDMQSAFSVFSKFSLKNEVSYNTIIVGYCEHGDVDKAKEIFYQMELEGKKKDTISWNSMISGYVNNSMFDEALHMFLDMVSKDEAKADSYTLGSVLSACANIASFRCGKEVHSLAIVGGLDSNSFVGGALVEMYCKCQDLDAALKAFDEVKEKDIATWNALISGYARCDQFESIHTLLQHMKEDGFEPNAFTFNGIIAGYVENERNEMALKLFSEMQASNCFPDIYTVGMILTACAKLASVERGKQVHSYAIKLGYEADSFIGAALVDMYAKCGTIRDASLVHSLIKDLNLVTQNAMLTAYAMHGHGEEGIGFFRSLLLNGFRPDGVTFLSVLSSCVHVGSVETGQEFFNLMRHYGVRPTLKHYTCMVDLLSRAGQLNKAYNVIKKMPMAPDSVIWGALLGGCVKHRNVGIGELAAKKLIELEPDIAGNYVMLANLYAFAGRWTDLAITRQVIDDKQIYKSPGCSWIEDKDGIHMFVASDKSHDRATEIYSMLDLLRTRMKLVHTI